MKDAISRVVVEVIKHEWPSKWRSLLHDLFNISQRGVITTALISSICLGHIHYTVHPLFNTPRFNL